MGVRPLDHKLLGLFGNHAAIRVGAGGKRQVGELKNVDDKNYIEVRTNSAADNDQYDWVRVDVPDGMTSEQFDAAVVEAFNAIGAVRRHQPYSWHGSLNSNRFVYDVISEAGGKVPIAAYKRPEIQSRRGVRPSLKAVDFGSCVSPSARNST